MPDGQATPLAGKPKSRPPRPEPLKGHIAVGYILGAHGLEGELRVDSLSDNPDRFRAGVTLRAGEASLSIRSIRTHKGALLIAFEGIHSREQAEELRGVLLEVPEIDLPPLDPDQYYRFQLIGLEVRDKEGNILGRLEEVLETGANDVYIVRDDDSELLVPAIESVVKQVNISEKTMVIELLPGMERRPLKKNA